MSEKKTQGNISTLRKEGADIPSIQPKSSPNPPQPANSSGNQSDGSGGSSKE